MRILILNFLIFVYANYITAQTVTIGNQIWNTKNLDVTTFNNGDPILEAKTKDEWIKASSNGIPAYCYYENKPSNKAKFGLIYNGYALTDKRGIAPNGWMIPSNTDWFELLKFTNTDYREGERIRGNKAFLSDEPDASDKFRSNTLWADNANGTNLTGLSIYPSGMILFNGDFSLPNGVAKFWTSTLINDGWQAYTIGFYSGALHIEPEIFSNGFSVRCIKGKINNSTSQSSTNNTTTSNINDFESNANNIPDINSRLKYIQNVIGTAASQNDTKLLTRAIIQYNSNILSDPNIDKELFIFGRLINESSLPQILQNGISEDEKSMFSVSSFYYVMCQLNIENNFDALNKDVVNGILNNFSSNSYFSKDLYLALEKKKNEKSNSTSPSNQSTETAKSEKYNEWLRNVKIEYVNNYSGNKCKWCSTNVQCEKKSQEKLVDDVNSGKMAVKFMIFFGLDLFSSLDQPLEIDLYKCPEFCSLKCEHDYRKAGY